MTPPHPSSLVEKVAAALNTRGIPAERIEAAVRVVVERCLDEIAWIDITDDEFARGRNDAFHQCDKALRSLLPSEPEA